MALRSGLCLLRQYQRCSNPFRVAQTVGYKSQYNVETLYPNSSLDFISNPVFKHTQADGGEFIGYIPVEKLDIRYSRSSGAGGQHVNKVNSKVEVRFHVASADWLSEKAREALLNKVSGKITNDGFLIVRSEKTRKQLLNQADCMAKLREMICDAVREPYTPTEEELLIQAKREEKARKAMLREKRSHSQKKQSRQKPDRFSV